MEREHRAGVSRDGDGAEPGQSHSLLPVRRGHGRGRKQFYPLAGWSLVAAQTLHGTAGRAFPGTCAAAFILSYAAILARTDQCLADKGRGGLFQRGRGRKCAAAPSP